MTRLAILTWPDPKLASVCTPVGEITPEVTELAGHMLETMYAAPGRGLAAPQVGVLSRLFVMDTTWKEQDKSPMVFVDPVLLWSSETTSTNSEGCLSIPGVAADVTRPDQIRLRWTDLNGVLQEKDFNGFEAICIQHEMDHLEGLVTLDRVDDQTRARVLKDYSEVTA